MYKLVLGAALLAASVVAVAQQKYPQRTLEVVVPYAPGGGTDNLMRMITGIIDENKWSPAPMNVINRAGGSGAVGYNYLINKKGDSHVVAGATPMIVSGKIEGRLPGNHRDAMTTLMIVAIDELMLSVRSESKLQTIEDFVKAAKERPGQLTVAGTGTTEKRIRRCSRRRGCSRWGPGWWLCWPRAGSGPRRWPVIRSVRSPRRTRPGCCPWQMPASWWRRGPG